MKMDSDDINFLETKFNGVFSKIDSNQRCITEKITDIQKDLSETIKNNSVELAITKTKLKGVKENLEEHEDNPCIKITNATQQHYVDEHKGMMGKMIIRVGGIITAVIVIIEVIRRFLLSD